PNPIKTVPLAGGKAEVGAAANADADGGDGGRGGPPQRRLADPVTQRTLAPIDAVRQLKRFTLVLEDHAVNPDLGNANLASYDLLAVQPTTEKAFQLACLQLPVDVIAVDLGQRLPFYFRRTTVGAAVVRGVHFEIGYGPCIRDQTARRNLLSNAQALVNASGGKNIIITSQAQRAMDLRGPYDIVNLATLFGLSHDQAKKCLTSNCRSVLYHAATRRDTYRGVVAMEAVSELTEADRWKLGDVPTADEMATGLDFVAFDDD
ncbi:Ribonuclease P protein subunit p30, partial [Cladochytrium tenue]